MKDKIYYKYRSLNGDNWEYLLDIILNNRLYCAKYNELNDPMEGVFYVNNRNKEYEEIDRLVNGKESVRICSLTENSEEPLMWGHYADGNRGIAIGVKVNKNTIIHPINYNGRKDFDLITVKPEDLFIHKNPDWSYEKEIRIFSKTLFQKIEIVEIIFGVRTDIKQKKLLTKLIQKINPNIVLKQQNRNCQNENLLNINQNK
ncbi:MAG: hypothetical protein RL264_757 [Bacteroidota bacterium]|jgi:hypothetical protein